MALTNRLTLFFFATLAVVLGAFSVAIFTLASIHLNRQFDDRATATLDTLTAAVEVEADGLEWEPRERRTLLSYDGPFSVWALFDENGARLDGSPGTPYPLDHHASSGEDMQQSRTDVAWNGDRWRVVCRTIRHPRPEAVSPNGPPDRLRYRTLVFVTACPRGPIRDLLSILAWCLAGVSGAMGVLAGVGSRWVCRRALAPVCRMTGSVEEITADDLGQRLPVPETRDQIHDLAEAFNGLLGRLQDSFERQRRFAGEASHQLRTPLTAMIGQMEVALRRDRPADEYRRVLTSAVAQAGQLGGIVESLLFLARADADAELPGLERIDLVAWVRGYLDDNPHDRSGDVRFDARVACVHIGGQNAMLAQVVGNLIENACRYSDPGSPIVLTVAVEGEEAVLTIEDVGCGIESAELGRIFEPFFRAADARRRGIKGMGLGLAVARRIVRSFGGRIEARSEWGKGSRFVVRLPIRITA